MALPKESQDMVRLMRVMLDAWASHDHPSETWLEIVEQADRRKRKPGHGCRWLCWLGLTTSWARAFCTQPPGRRHKL